MGLNQCGLTSLMSDFQTIVSAVEGLIMAIKTVYRVTMNPRVLYQMEIGYGRAHMGIGNLKHYRRRRLKMIKPCHN